MKMAGNNKKSIIYNENAYYNIKAKKERKLN